MSWNNRGRFVSPSDAEERRQRQPTNLAEKYDISDFDLFCAYHLGITKEGTYQFQNVHQVAKQFGVNAAIIKQLLADFGIDSDTIIHSDFDLAGAQVDIMLAPPGVDLFDIGRQYYMAFRSAPKRNRNWFKELEEAARDNERIFGRKD